MVQFPFCLFRRAEQPQNSRVGETDSRGYVENYVIQNVFQRGIRCRFDVITNTIIA